VYLPKINHAGMNGLINSWESGMGMGASLAAYGVSSITTLIGVIGQGMAYTSMYTDPPDRCQSDLRVAWILAVAAILGGGLGVAAMFTRERAMMRAETALDGLLIQFGTAGEVMAGLVFQRGEDVPAAGWEPPGSYTPTAPVR
jgi:hypothetical protein